MNRSFPAIAAACLLASGCGDPQARNDGNASSVEYRTGSNIPRRDGAGTDRVQTATPDGMESIQVPQPRLPTGR